MSYESAQDRANLLQSLGEQVSVGGQSLYGILENEFTAVELAGQMIEGNYPVLSIRESDADSAGVVHGTAVVAGGVNYTVRSVEADGTGMVDLVLEAAA